MGIMDWIRSIAGGGKTVSYEEYRVEDKNQQAGDDSTKYGLNFQQAIEAHQKWKNRLSSYIDGSSREELDCRVVGCDNKCVLGIWIYSSGKDAFGGDPLYVSMLETHAQFHTVACEVVQLKQAGDLNAAKNLLTSGLYNQLSVKLQGLLAKLYLSGK